MQFQYIDHSYLEITNGASRISIGGGGGRRPIGSNEGAF